MERFDVTGRCLMILLLASVISVGCASTERSDAQSKSDVDPNPSMQANPSTGRSADIGEAGMAGLYVGRASGGAVVRLNLKQTSEGAIGYGTVGALNAVFVEQRLHAIHGTMSLEDGRTQRLTLLLTADDEVLSGRPGAPMRLRLSSASPPTEGRLTGRFEVRGGSEGRIRQAHLAESGGMVVGIVVAAGQRCSLVGRTEDAGGFSADLTFPSGAVTPITGRLQSRNRLVIEGAGPTVTLFRD